MHRHAGSLHGAICILVHVLIAALLSRCESFTITQLGSRVTTITRNEVTRLHLFFADEVSVSSEEGPTVNLLRCGRDEASMRRAAIFMVDAFWLNSPQNLVQGGNNGISDTVRTVLLREQAVDFTNKYGERMGKRLLESCLLTATPSVEKEDTDNILGVVGMEVCLLDKPSESIMGADKAEVLLRNAVASLKPSERRKYKDSSVQELAATLLPPEISLICCLSNLAVSPQARRKGVAQRLCEEAERIARVEWGFDDMFLKVENDNTAARYLYEKKLGYLPKYDMESASALRVDTNKGCFVEIQSDTLILSKKCR